MRRWAALAEELRRRLGPGAALDASARAVLRSAIDADLAGVVIHRGSLAGRLARRLGADAFSVGAHVFGSEARLDTTTRRGSALVAHEVVHALRPARSAVVGPVVQRSPADAAGSAGHDHEEILARVVEARVLEQQPSEGGGMSPGLDLDELTERVYQRLADTLVLERERAAYLS
jgi:hypothetical protein